jgi:hypothetical protein
VGILAATSKQAGLKVVGLVASVAELAADAIYLQLADRRVKILEKALAQNNVEESQPALAAEADGVRQNSGPRGGKSAAFLRKVPGSRGDSAAVSSSRDRGGVEPAISALERLQCSSEEAGACHTSPEQAVMHRALLPVYREMGGHMAAIEDALLRGDAARAETEWDRLALLLDRVAGVAGNAGRHGGCVPALSVPPPPPTPLHPVLSGTMPADGDRSVLDGTQIWVVFSEPVRVGDRSAFEGISVADEAGHP